MLSLGPPRIVAVGTILATQIRPDGKPNVLAVFSMSAAVGVKDCINGLTVVQHHLASRLAYCLSQFIQILLGVSRRPLSQRLFFTFPCLAEGRIGTDIGTRVARATLAAKGAHFIYSIGAGHHSLCF